MGTSGSSTRGPLWASFERLYPGRCVKNKEDGRTGYVAFGEFQNAHQFFAGCYCLRLDEEPDKLLTVTHKELVDCWLTDEFINDNRIVPEEILSLQRNNWADTRLVADLAAATNAAFPKSSLFSLGKNKSHLSPPPPSRSPIAPKPSTPLPAASSPGPLPNSKSQDKAAQAGQGGLKGGQANGSAAKELFPNGGEGGASGSGLSGLAQDPGPARAVLDAVGEAKAHAKALAAQQKKEEEATEGAAKKGRKKEGTRESGRRTHNPRDRRESDYDQEENPEKEEKEKTEGRADGEEEDTDQAMEAALTEPIGNSEEEEEEEEEEELEEEEEQEEEGGRKRGRQSGRVARHIESWTGIKIPSELAVVAGDKRADELEEDELDGEYEVDQILDECVVSGKRYYLIKWSGYQLRPGTGPDGIRDGENNEKGDWEPAKSLPKDVVRDWTKSPPDWWTAQKEGLRLGSKGAKAGQERGTKRKKATASSGRKRR